MSGRGGGRVASLVGLYMAVGLVAAVGCGEWVVAFIAAKLGNGQG